MAWLTNKKTGAVFNTEWAKERQIEANKKEADSILSKEAKQYKDNTDLHAFVKENKDQLRADGKSVDAMKQEWYNVRHAAEIKNLKEIDIEEAIDTVKSHIRSSAISGWFREANSEYKPEIAESILDNHEVLNAGLNIAYYNYRWQYERYSQLYEKWIPHDGVDISKKLSFKDWLTTPQTMYRGSYGQKTVDSDVFISYTPDKKIAEKFASSNKGEMSTMQIRPIDTWGSYQTTGEQEFLIPIKFLKEK